MEDAVVNLLELYPEQFEDENVVKAERRGITKLVLFKLDEPYQRVDGEFGEYQLSDYTLTEAGDDAGVMWDDWSYWKASELDLTKGLFEQFNLFP